MSLFGSLFAGVSGISAQSKAMGMISDNIANVNTTAYKGAIAQFATLVTRAAHSVAYTPGGVRTYAQYTIGTQGLIQSSASPTDVAIAGNGFFVVNPSADGRLEQLYTRAGSFLPDYLGNLKTPAGFFLQGWALDADEQIIDVNALETVNIRSVSGFATATTNVELGANLNADQPAHGGAYAGGDMASWTAGLGGVQPHFTRDVRVYDSLGRAHNVTLAFLNDAAPNVWNVEVFANPADVDAGTHGANGLLAAGQVTFNGDGTLGAIGITPVAGGAAGDPIGIVWDAGLGADPSSVALNLGQPGVVGGLTQFASPFSVAFVTQNGAEVGQLSGVSISEEGFVVASFTNGESRRLYRLPIATFANPAALDPRTGNVYGQTDASGEFNLRFAGDGGAGLLTPSALEAANVDIADEFTKMIITQRAYSANARVISTTDEMLDELIRIKR
jgi:flagellar hook protein FlgE